MQAAFDQGVLHLPSERRTPAKLLVGRLFLSLGLAAFVTALAYLDRGGYTDATDGSVSLLDAFYYATVSITTTGYGDIVPVSDRARLVTALFVTPARVLFLILLVGTTVEVLVSDSRNALRHRSWRKGLRDHTILCGFGATGQAAARTMLARGHKRDSIVVVETDADRVAEAKSAGIAVIHGSAGHEEVLKQAGIAHAAAVLVATSTDESVVLITLTAREFAPEAMIAAKVRDERTVHLARQSGADSVVVSSGAAGRLLGHAPDDSRLVDLLDDLLLVGQGLDVVIHDVNDDQVGPLRKVESDGPVIAILRGERLIRFDNSEAESVLAGDRIVVLAPPAATQPVQPL